MNQRAFLQGFLKVALSESEIAGLFTGGVSGLTGAGVAGAIAPKGKKLTSALKGGLVGAGLGGLGQYAAFENTSSSGHFQNSTMPAYLTAAAGSLGGLLGSIGSNKGKPEKLTHQELRASPALAALLSVLPPSPLVSYGQIKDIKNRQAVGLDKAYSIDKGKFFSKRRGKHVSARSHAYREATERLKSMGVGAALGAGTGALAGALPSLQGHSENNYSPVGALFGGLAGSLIGVPVGAYRGAKRYNEEVIDKLR